MSVQSVLFVHLAFLYGPSPHAPGSLCGAGSPCTHPQALRPAPGGVYAELVAPALTDAGAPREHGKAMLGTQGDFLPDEKVTKESPRGVSPLGTPLGGHYHPPSSAARCSPQKDSPRGVGGELVVCASLRARGCRGPFYPQPIPLGQGAGESKGVLPLVLEVQEPGGSW